MMLMRMMVCIGKGNVVHLVCTQSKVLHVGNYVSPSFGPFLQVTMF